MECCCMCGVIEGLWQLPSQELDPWRGQEPGCEEAEENGSLHGESTPPHIGFSPPSFMVS